MVFRGIIDAETRAYVKYLTKHGQISTREIIEKTGVSRATIYRIKKEKAGDKSVSQKRRRRGGRPTKLDARDERQLLRSLKILRKEEGQFSSKRLMEKAGIQESQASNRTVRRCLKRHGYHFLQARKKGLMSSADLKRRVAFAKKVKKTYPTTLWTEMVGFFLDGVSFYYKKNPAGQARAPRGRIWRQKSEGLKQGCTAKGSKEGSGGKVLKLLVAITHGKGVIDCYRYEKMDGPFFASFVNSRFKILFAKASKRASNLFVQDNCPVQNSNIVKETLKENQIEQLKIPARSPDLNPIENLFHRVKNKLRLDALNDNINCETFDEFTARVKRTMYNFSVAEIDKCIESMNHRLNLVIRSKGERIKY